MSIFKCKMCGGNLEVTGESSVVTCEYCGTSQTISKSRDEVVSNLYNRANDLRLKCEFDRAEQTYEKILEQDNTEAEAHWGIVLCRYGIEYVDDPATSKKIPTCHRTSYEAITSNADYIASIQNADSEQKAVYEAEARAIDKIQKNILSIVKNEEPFDVFICYKETDENGKRTVDSTIANDIYYQLTQEGFKVFYAPITLEDKLGQEYEPYIFAALNSAKVMLVVGTKPEYFNAVWVKNEWSRFLKLLKADRSKMIIPCYRDMDAYDLPDEFAHLQSQDMSKIGFINDVVRGVKKVIASVKVHDNNQVQIHHKDITNNTITENNRRTMQEKLDTQLLLKKATRLLMILSGIACLFLCFLNILDNIDTCNNYTIAKVSQFQFEGRFEEYYFARFHDKYPIDLFVSEVGWSVALSFFGLSFLFRKKIPFLQLGHLTFLASFFIEWNFFAHLYTFNTIILFSSFLFAVIVSILPKKGVSKKSKNIVWIISIVLLTIFSIAYLNTETNFIGIIIACIQLSLWISFEGYDAIISKIEKLRSEIR